MSAIAIFLGGLLVLVAVAGGLMSVNPSALARALRYGLPVGLGAFAVTMIMILDAPASAFRCWPSRLPCSHAPATPRAPPGNPGGIPMSGLQLSRWSLISIPAK
jgi:hypothetical protein